jgi:membrane-associated protease RseP (regulator of RpoE activity)
VTTGNKTINWLLSLALLTTSSMLAAQQDEAAQRAELRQEIQQARTEMAEAARRMARLQRQLGARETGLEIVRLRADGSAAGDEDVSIRFEDSEALTLKGMPPRLGVLLGGPGSDATNEIIGLTPGGGAEAAGIQQGDRLVSVNEKTVAKGAPESVRDALEGVEAGSTVAVIVERDGKRLAFDVETTSVVRDVRVFGLRQAPEAGEFEREIVIMRHDGARLGTNAMSPKPPFPPRAPLFSALGKDSDLIGNHAGLEPYFGTAEGVVVLRIDPENDFDLRAGDVVLRLDDEAINRPVDLGRLLLGRDPDEKVVFEVMREGVLTQIQTTIPERSESIHAFPMRIEIKTAPEPPAAPRPPQPL